MAFIELGIPIWLAILIIPRSLIGSIFNIPLYKIKSDLESCTQDSHVLYYGVNYQVFHLDCPGETQININLGGAIFPVLVSGYLIMINLTAVFQYAIAIISLLVHRVARIVPDIGILTSGFLSAIAAVFVTILFFILMPGAYNAYALAYVCGTLGTLISSDILNLNKLSKLRTRNASIGGAGTWDCVFLTGILAVFLL